ncbi:MAG: toll/interleukin-1 receptor domain-containing protein [Anaerolineae bacterium]|nr:toll/interleukin-1 receptor domain-containing protein [Anaerolineae bacterium]
MMAWQAFLSYSRQQYYLAETLALKLEKVGVALWFDVQQLEPGTNWQQDIADGLAGSNGVVLLASRAALRSPYVEREWRAALTAGKPVIVARCERVRLPRDLRTAPVVDLGGDFDEAAETLAGVIAQPAHPPRERRGTRRLPPGVARMALALTVRDAQNVLIHLLTTIAVLSLIVYSSVARYLAFTLDIQSNPLWIIAMTVGAIVLVIGKPEPLRMPAFLRHEFDYRALTTRTKFSTTAILWLWLFLATGWLDFVRDYFEPRGTEPASFSLLVFIGLGIIVTRLMTPRYRRLMPAHPDPDIIRWAVLGRVPPEWRTTVLRTEGSPIVPKRSARGNLSLHVVSEADDQDELKLILPIVEQIGGAVVADDQPANVELIMLNHNTSRARVLDALARHQRVLGVLTSRCNLSKDLLELTRLQLIDFSDRDGQALYAQLGLLTAQDDSERAGLQTYLDPVSLRHLPAPAMVTYLAVTLLALVLFCLLMAPILLLSEPQAGIPGLAAPVGFGLLAGGLLLAYAFVQHGRVLFGSKLIVMVLACLPLALAAVARLGLPFADGLPDAILAIFPYGWAHPLIIAGLLAGATIAYFSVAPHMLAHKRDALGMPALSLIPQLVKAVSVIAGLYVLALSILAP